MDDGDHCAEGERERTQTGEKRMRADDGDHCAEREINDQRR